MMNLEGVNHHPVMEELTEILSNRTQNEDKTFFRCMVAYYLAKMASNMRAIAVTQDRGKIPINLFSILLAGSGYGKGHSIGIMETEVIHTFKRRFIDETLPVLVDQNLWVLADEKAIRKGTQPQEEFDKLTASYNRMGAYAFTFDKGTEPAIKQLRQKLLLANAGAISSQVDELGLNLSASMEVLTVFLELFDKGHTKEKLTKNTEDSARFEDIDGHSPTNMLLFGAPSKLFDGGATEQLFNSMLDTGYARRCLFAFGQVERSSDTMTSEEEYDKLANPKNEANLKKWANHFYNLADPGMHGWEVKVERDVGVQLIEYKRHCEIQANKMPTSEEIKRAELAHRYMKVLKLAGAYAFVDQSNFIELDHLFSAIKLVEESGDAFYRIMHQEQAHVRLAKFIAEVKQEVTHSDLLERLKFFPKQVSARRDMINLAIEWGYKNNIIIKKNFVNVGTSAIEQYKGETLTKTNLDDMIFSYSTDFAYDYAPDDGPVAFDQLHNLTQGSQENGEPLHWANHRFKNGHRCDENVLPGFNMLVIDVDGGNLELAQKLLSEIMFMTYTTKRHTDEQNRFRLIIPTNYILELDKDEYREVVSEVINWLPFKASMDIDAASTQRSKKWTSFEGGSHYYNLEGALFDILPFIPRTAKNEAYRKEQKEIGSMDNLERWFASRMFSGNRNNHMIKYALALVDSGLDFTSLCQQVLAFNKKLPDPMDEAEFHNSVFVTAAKRIESRTAG